MKKILTLALLGLLFSCSSDKETVYIVHVNDIHGKLDNFSKLAEYVDDLRDDHDNVFLVSSGDLFSGNPYVELHEKPGSPVIELMNELEFDASCLGSHDLDFGQAVANERIQEADFPFVNANLVRKAGAKLMPLPDYTSVETDKGVQVNFVGLIENTNAGKMYTRQPSNQEALLVQVPLIGAEDVIQRNQLERKGINILLSHCGLPQDTEIAKKLNYYPVILGGQSHTRIEDGRMVHGTLIGQAHEQLNSFGLLTLELQKDSIVHKKYEIIDCKDLEDYDGDIADLVEEFNSNPHVTKKLQGE